MSECHKMKRYAMYPDNTELWACPICPDYSWIVTPQEGAPKVRHQSFDREKNTCHTIATELKPEDLVLKFRIGIDDDRD